MTVHTEFEAIDPAQQFWVDVYHLMNSIVQPRPIAWIASVSKQGEHNLSPFSYFNICSMNPPVISNSIFFNRDGSKKDTLKNIEATRRYVVGRVSSDTAERANLSSAPFRNGRGRIHRGGRRLRGNAAQTSRVSSPTARCS